MVIGLAKQRIYENRVISDQTSFLIWEKEGKVHLLHHEWNKPLSSDRVDIGETVKMFTERAKSDFIAEEI